MNHRMIYSLVALLTLVHAPVGAAEPPRAGAAIDQLFIQKVYPLLEEKCLACHGKDENKIKGKFDMRTRQGLLAGGESGQASLMPGEPDKSPLFIAVTWKDEDLQMPPKENDRLTAEQIDVLRRWIAGGAPWPDLKATAAGKSPGGHEAWAGADADGIVMPSSGGQSDTWTSRRYKPEDVWAFFPIQRQPAPPGPHPIDAFIDQKLAEKKLAPAGRADKHTLIRRATYDLTGLPPTEREIADFLADDSPQAFEKVIDRLLASRHYGERMAQHWLDVVRYADTSGFSNDFERPNAWRYRDYVVRSFNTDKPYDQFVIEQIAGDEWNPRDPESLIAAGFLRMGPWEHTGMSVAAVTRQLFLDDVTNAVGETFLAQGLRCAKCHDHKFDPLPTRDYYRMQAVFAPVQFADRDVPFLPDENLTYADSRLEWARREAAKAKAEQEKYRKKAKDALEEHLRVHGKDSLKEQDGNRQFFGLTAEEKTWVKIAQKAAAHYDREVQRYQPLAFSVYSGPEREPPNETRTVSRMPTPQQMKGPAQAIHILRGGALEAPGDVVSPGVLSAMYGSNDAQQPTAWNTMPQATHGRRLAAAQWIASENNTLTSRVIVNRIWAMHFAGKGLVGTPNNFGRMGKKPTHPELLDWLAVWFTDRQWSIKKLHRLIMTSAAYQRASDHDSIEAVRTADPDNHLLAHYPARRLSAEEIRDSMLAFSGELNPELGGPPVFAQINWETAMQPRHIMGSVAPAYQPDVDPKQRNRRTIYNFVRRTLADPMLEVFNKPGPDLSCEMRDQTTVTPQAFTQINSQWSLDRAVALAAWAAGQAKDDAGRIERVYQRVHGRSPDASERAACLSHLARMAEHHRSHSVPAMAVPLVVKRNMIEELTGEPIAWTETLDLLKNYKPDRQMADLDPPTRALAEVCLVLLNSNEFLYLY